MQSIFNTVIYQPLFNIFIALYNVIPDVGIVILLITALIKAVLYPLTSKSIQAQKSLTELQPKLEALKKTHKDNQQALAQETMKLYKENKVNPLGSCLPLLVQLPIFIGLYWVLQAGLAGKDFSALYSFVPNPGSVSPISLGTFDLSKAHNYVLAILAGLAQFWQARMTIRKRPPKNAGEGAKDEDMMSMMNKQMLFMMPALTVIIGIKLPAGLSLYWFFSTLLTGLQQYILFRKKSGSGENKPPSDIIEGKIVGS